MLASSGANIADKNECVSSTEKTFSIIYASSEIFVVNKPFDVAMDTPQKSAQGGTAVGVTPSEALTVERWAYQYIQAREAQSNSNDADKEEKRHAPPQHQKRPFKIIHQLDYATSGVLLFAFYNKKKAAVLASLFERRLAKKMYVAYVVGHIDLQQYPQKEAEGLESDGNEILEDRGEMDLPTRLLLKNCRRGAFVERIEHHEKEEVLFSTSTSATPDIEKEMTVYRHADTVEKLRSTNSFTGLRRERLQICFPIGHAVSAPCTNSSSSNSAPKVDATGAEAYFQMQIDGKDARAALTYLYVLEEGYFPLSTTSVHVPVTKVALRPCTGRRHQLRLHCQSIGHPICGDVAYYHTDSHVNRTTLVPSSSDGPTADGAIEVAPNMIHCYDKPQPPCLSHNKRDNRTFSTFDYTAAMAGAQRRMYLHAQSLALPLCVEALDRAAADTKHSAPNDRSTSDGNFSFKDDAKRRRRIKMGMENDDAVDELNVWTVFSAADDFEALLPL